MKKLFKMLRWTLVSILAFTGVLNLSLYLISFFQDEVSVPLNRNEFLIASILFLIVSVVVAKLKITGNRYID
ncbi:hypothetical protein [Pontibacter vulgaris]|uniref:hypothetical protein n=1 Tax=Pontibacter vulgaris TaxID=2905679 RepID=UPI001FA80FAE|nr:hypothetical protein [Pontibacter vulgaris]